MQPIIFVLFNLIIQKKLVYKVFDIFCDIVKWISFGYQFAVNIVIVQQCVNFLIVVWSVHYNSTVTFVSFDNHDVFVLL